MSFRVIWVCGAFIEGGVKVEFLFLTHGLLNASFCEEYRGVYVACEMIYC